MKIDLSEVYFIISQKNNTDIKMGCYHSSELREFEKFRKKLHRNNGIISKIEFEMKKNNNFITIYEKSLQDEINYNKNIIYSLY